MSVKLACGGARGTGGPRRGRGAQDHCDGAGSTALHGRLAPRRCLPAVGRRTLTLRFAGLLRSVLVCGVIATAGRASASAACIRGCNGSGSVTVDELVNGVNIALDRQPLPRCAQFNSATGVAVDGNGNVFVCDENPRVRKFACP